jgi:catechol-2,3-dioxygenase
MSDGNPKSSPDNPGIGQMRGGLIFLKTKDRPSLVKFYMETIQMKIWLEQPDITIMSHGNFLLGLHHKPDQEPEIFGMYTFVYPSKEEVDEMYDRFQHSTADGPPRVNGRYHIYQFFAKDPEGRQLEFQAFLHPISEVSSKAKGFEKERIKSGE